MIQLVQRNALDVAKYNTCIKNSLQSRVYAFSWYLDIVAESWSVLVLDDYKAVMPLPWNTKLGLKYISQPFFCQQLGVFSLANVSEKEIKTFIKAIPKKFVKIAYQFNAENYFESAKNALRTNYILDLKDDYTLLRKKFRKDRKYRINQVLKKNYTITECSSKDLIAVAQKHYQFLDIAEKEYQKLAKIIDFSTQNNKGFTKAVYENGHLMAGSFFLTTNQRITYLFSVMTPKGQQNNIHSLLLNSVIKEYAQSNLILDFEGSMIKSIASFYKSFGAKPETYRYYLKRVL